MKIQYYKKPNCCSGEDFATPKILEEIITSEDSLQVFGTQEEADQGGVPELPALVIDGKLIISGYTPSKKELTKVFKKLTK